MNSPPSSRFHSRSSSSSSSFSQNLAHLDSSTPTTRRSNIQNGPSPHHCIPDSSFSKRHASLESPREIPMSPGMPYMSLGRPFSSPGEPSFTASSASSSSSSSPFSSSQPPSASNRASSSSLPLPMQTPYYSLPSVVDEEHQHHSHQSSATSNSHQHHHQQQQQKLHDSTAVPSTNPSYRSAMLRLTSLSSHHPQKLISSSRDCLHSSSSYPPPDPPTILPAYTELRDGQKDKAAHAYESFLSTAPPPEDSWIAVETIPEEYRLLVRLPGFQRDGITLATRRRRILHVVADSWNPGGGHFERRISFGYDADLTRVRAEFDGDLLRVIIPRRPPPIYF